MKTDPKAAHNIAISGIVPPKIIPPGAEKFTEPPPILFGLVGAWASVISLLTFAAMSGWAILKGVEQRHLWWSYAPFVFTFAGSFGGFLYEIWLLLRSRPFQLLGTSTGMKIQALRTTNLAFVFGSVYLAYCLYTFEFSEEIIWLIFASGITTGFLLVTFLFRGPLLAGIIVLTLGLLAQIVLLYAVQTLPGGGTVRGLLLLAAVGLYATTIIGSQTPWRSTAFHVIATGVVALLAFAAKLYFEAPAIISSGAPTSTVSVVLRLAAAIPLGAFLAFHFLPRTWATFRSELANAVWPLFYLIIAGGKRILRPDKLSRVYEKTAQQLKPLQLMPYYLSHSRNLTHPISIPSLDEALTLKVHYLGFFGQLVKLVFGIGSVLNSIFPFAKLTTPLAEKPRMLPWSDGRDYWPVWLTKSVWLPRLGWFKIESGVKGPGLQPTPQIAIEKYREGQLLAFLAEYGAAGALLTRVKLDGAMVLALDFEFLEAYESKPDYERYGGVAFFVIDEHRKCLRLTHIRGPRSPVLIPADPTLPTFRHVEDIILSSFYFLVVSGKHLVEIHMGLNLVEVALFNAFDARKEWDHPVRLALYPHLFAHELAEELTTENLLEDNAIFPQIFATTGSSLMRHLNDRFTDYELGIDEDFDRREQVLLSGHPGANLQSLLPNASLLWEREYGKVWLAYATKLVNAAFKSDAEIQVDIGIQTLFLQLRKMFAKALPPRYCQFTTKAGIARFIADVIHHLVVSHEIYGTTAVRLAMDPRINKVQVPKDGGPCAVDEWRALACIAMATSRVRYTLLMPTDWRNVFEDLKDSAVRTAYDAAYVDLKAELTALEEQWQLDSKDNYEMLRVLPSELDLGAGY